MAENTFQLEPKEDERFLPGAVRRIVQDVIQEKLENSTYEHISAQSTAVEVCGLIRQRIKSQLKIPRFKFAVQVVLAENKGQGLRVCSKALWDDQYDNYSTYTYTINNLIAVAMVFGCYFE
jgi:hypothetical protein